MYGDLLSGRRSCYTAWTTTVITFKPGALTFWQVVFHTQWKLLPGSGMWQHVWSVPNLQDHTVTSAALQDKLTSVFNPTMQLHHILSQSCLHGTWTYLHIKETKTLIHVSLMVASAANSIRAAASAVCRRINLLWSSATKMTINSSFKHINTKHNYL